MKDIAAVLKSAFAGWQKDNVSRLSAALAYYTIFSIVPLLVITIAVVGLVFGRQAAEGQIVAQIQSVVGRESAEFIQTTIQVADQKDAGLFATLIGPVTLALGALGLFGHLKDSLNAIWGVEPPKGRGILRMVKDRFLSFAMVLGTGFLLLTSLVLSAGLQALGVFLQSAAPGVPLLIQTANFALSFLLTTVLFAAIFQILPDRRVRWDDVWFGAALTSLLFTIGKFVIGFYIGTAGTASAYGAAGSLVVLLLWIYYSCLILFTGAEITRAYAVFHHPGDAKVEADTPAADSRSAAPSSIGDRLKAVPVRRPLERPAPAAVARSFQRARDAGTIEKPGTLGYVLLLLVFGGLFALSRIRGGRARRAVSAG